MSECLLDGEMSKCPCNVSISVLGDGCRHCQPQEYIDRMTDWIDEARDEIVALAKGKEDLEQRLADVEEELDELYKELFIFAHDVMCFENDKMPDWVFEKAKAIYDRLCLGKVE